MIEMSPKLKALIRSQVPDPNNGPSEHMFLKFMEELVVAVNNSGGAVDLSVIEQDIEQLQQDYGALEGRVTGLEPDTTE